MDGCISYLSSGSIRVRMISNVIKQFLLPYFLSTAKPEEQEEEDEEQGEREQEDKKKEAENDGIGSFFVIKRNNTCMSFDGSAEIPRHDQLHSPWVQLRQVSESVRMRGEERSFPVRVHGPSGEARRHRSSTERGLLQSTEERRYFRRRLRQLTGGLVQQWHDDVARLSRLVKQQGRGSLSSGNR